MSIDRYYYVQYEGLGPLMGPPANTDGLWSIFDRLHAEEDDEVAICKGEGITSMIVDRLNYLENRERGDD